MTLQEHGIPFTNFFGATLAALLVGKAVLVVDNLPFMRRFDGAPLIQPILYALAVSTRRNRSAWRISGRCEAPARRS